MTVDPLLPAACHRDVACVTCADEGVPMRVVELVADELAACAAHDGAVTEVDPALVGPVAPGDVLLVHAGVAIARLDGEVAA